MSELLSKVGLFFYARIAIFARITITTGMKTSVILRFVILGLLWLGLVTYIVVNTPKFTLYTAFVIVASAIIIFVPIYKKYVKNDKQ